MLLTQLYCLLRRALSPRLFGSAILLLLGLALLLPASAQAAAEAKVKFDVPAGEASKALKTFAKQAQREIMFPLQPISGVKTSAVQGEFTVKEGLNKLLAGTELAVYEDEKTGGLVVQRYDDPNDRRAIAESTKSGRPEKKSDGTENDQGGKVVKLDTFEVFGRKTLNMDIQRTRDDVQPYVVYGRDSIERSGATSLEDFFRTQLPMNSVITGPNAQTAGSFLGSTSEVNLRGLGANQTLILVDGRRLPSINASVVGNSGFNQPDINGIPLSAIERIEVLPTTASGIYGGSATGGVINIILKRDYSSVEATLTYENTFDSDAATRRAEFTAGLTLEGGRTQVLLSASWSDSNDLLVGDRDFVRRAREDRLRRDPAAVLLALPVATTTNIRNGAPTVNGVIPNLVLKSGVTLSSPYTFVPGGYAGPLSDGGAAFVANAGKSNIELPFSFDGKRRTLIATPKRTALSLNVRRNFGSRIEGFVDLSLQQNNSRTLWTATNPIVAIPATAPNNPFTTAITVRYPTVGLGSARDLETETLREVVGVIVRLPRDWMTEADYTWGRSRLLAIGTQPEIGDPDGSGPGIAASTAWTNGTLDLLRDMTTYPLNWTPYLMPSPNSFAGPYETILDTYTLRAGGPIVQLPAGPLKLSTLYEDRREEAKIGYLDTVDASAVKSSTAVAGRSQTVQSFYVEARAPVFSNAFAFGLRHSLEFQASVRRDDYGTTAPTPRSATLASRTSPLPVFLYSQNDVQAMKGTVGFRYSPSNDVVIRASVGSGFLPPTITQVAPNPSAPSNIPMTDPKRSRVTTTVPNVALTGGGNPDLKAEKSQSYSAGIVLTPRMLPGFRLSVDYTSIRKTDEIAAMNVGSVLDLEDLVSGRVTRAPLTAADAARGYTGGVVTALDISALNLAKSEINAWDFQVDYTWKHEQTGQFSVYSVATWQPKLTRQTLPSTPAIDTIGFSDGPRAWRVNAGANWNRGPWTVGWNMQFYDSRRVYTSISKVAATTVASVGFERYPTYVFHDLFARYRFGTAPRGWAGILADTEISVGIQNALNREPAIVGGTDALGGFDATIDPRLRRYSISLKKRF